MGENYIAYIYKYLQYWICKINYKKVCGNNTSYESNGFIIALNSSQSTDKKWQPANLYTYLMYEC